MRKYKLKNIDCASCAANLETGLRKAGIDNSVDFVSSTIITEALDLEKLRTEVRKIEPDVEVEKIETGNNTAEQGLSKSAKNEIISMSIVLILFLAGLFVRARFENTPYEWIEYVLFLSAYLISGRGVLLKAGKNILKGRVFDEHFLMSIATLGAVAIHELPEAVAVMWFYNLGEFVQGLAVKKSRRSIKSLLEIRPQYANLIREGETVKISPGEIKIDDVIIVKPGEKIPLDGEVLEGNSFVDTFALTGESVPKRKKENDIVLSGMINKSGSLKVKVTKSFEESSISKILELVENAGKNKAKTEKFITEFARYYTPVVVLIALCIAVIPPLIVPGAAFSDWIYRALVILVISCPCALVISIPLAYFGGIGRASRRGILVKGSDFLDTLVKVKTVIFDKTGTLTEGIFKVTDIVPSNGFDKNDLLRFASAAESHSNHPIARSIIEAAGEYFEMPESLSVQETAGEGIAAEVKGKKVILGSEKFLRENRIEFKSVNAEGTLVHAAVDGNYAGYISISDKVRTDSETAVKKLRLLGVDNIVMLTGDNSKSAASIAEKTGIKKFFSDLLPKDKVEYIEKIISESINGKTIFVGDGINDAPVLARSDVGIAMGGLGSDAAVEAADIVLMNDSLIKVPESIEIASYTRRIIWQNIFIALFIKAFFIALGGMGLASMWEAVFADMGVALIAVFNSARLLK